MTFKEFIELIIALLEWRFGQAERLELRAQNKKEQGGGPVGVESMESISNTMEFDYVLAPKNRLGGAAAVDGAGVWTNDGPTIVELTVSGDGLSAHVKALGPLGTANINVVADADLGAGVTDITGVGTVVVSAAPASVIALEASAPTEQP